MKKLLMILLTAILGLSCLACSEYDIQEILDQVEQNIQTDISKTNNNDEKNKYQSSASLDLFTTVIRDNDGTDYCFWEDGQVWYSGFSFDYSAGDPDQYATLSTQTEYDLSFFMYKTAGISQSIWNLEFEYDETKIEIVHNPDIEDRFIIDKNHKSPEDHFILKVLQPCENEEIYITLWSKDPYSPRRKMHIRTCIVSTVESATSVDQAE